MERPVVILGPIIADNFLAKKCPRLSDCSIMTLAVAQWIMENEELLNETATVSRDNELRRKLAAIFKTLGKKYDQFLLSNGFKQWLDRKDTEATVDWDINDTTWISPIALYFSQNKDEKLFFENLNECIIITKIAASTICKNSNFIKCAMALSTSVFYYSQGVAIYDDTYSLDPYVSLNQLLERLFGYEIPYFLEVTGNNIDRCIDDANMLPLAVSYCEEEEGQIDVIDEITVSRLSYREKCKLYRLIIALSQAYHHSEPDHIDNYYKSKEFLPTELLEIHDRFVYNFLNSEYYFTAKISRRTFIDKLIGRNKEATYKYICKDSTIIESY